MNQKQVQNIFQIMKLFTIIHKKCNINWTEPIPVSGYMGEIVNIKPPKKKN